MAYDLSCFEAKHRRPIGTAALGTFLSNRLYLHRLQPMYALNLVAGLDAQGRIGRDGCCGCLLESRRTYVPLALTHTCSSFSSYFLLHNQVGVLFTATTSLAPSIEWPPRVVVEGRYVRRTSKARASIFNLPSLPPPSLPPSPISGIDAARPRPIYGRGP